MVRDLHVVAVVYVMGLVELAAHAERVEQHSQAVKTHDHLHGKPDTVEKLNPKCRFGQPIRCPKEWSIVWSVYQKWKAEWVACAEEQVSWTEHVRDVWPEIARKREPPRIETSLRALKRHVKKFRNMEDHVTCRATCEEIQNSALAIKGDFLKDMRELNYPEKKALRANKMINDETDLKRVYVLVEGFMRFMTVWWEHRHSIAKEANDGKCNTNALKNLTSVAITKMNSFATRLGQMEQPQDVHGLRHELVRFTHKETSQYESTLNAQGCQRSSNFGKDQREQLVKNTPGVDLQEEGMQPPVQRHLPANETRNDGEENRSQTEEEKKRKKGKKSCRKQSGKAKEGSASEKCEDGPASEKRNVSDMKAGGDDKADESRMQRVVAIVLVAVAAALLLITAGCGIKYFMSRSSESTEMHHDEQRSAYPAAQPEPTYFYSEQKQRAPAPAPAPQGCPAFGLQEAQGSYIGRPGPTAQWG